jgi:hypothetical protein
MKGQVRELPIHLRKEGCCMDAALLAMEKMQALNTRVLHRGNAATRTR